MAKHQAWELEMVNLDAINTISEACQITYLGSYYLF